MMRRIAVSVIACAALLVAAPPVGAEEDLTISYTYATEFVGQEMTVEGVVRATFVSENSGNLYLNFGDYKKDLSVQIPKKSLSKFPGNAETWYKGKKIRATGVIKWEKGLLRMAVSDMGHLKVME